MTLKKLLLIIAGSIGLVGAFLPWYSFSISFMGYSSSLSENAFGLGGWLYILLAILTMLASAALIVLATVPEKKIKSIVPKIKDLAKMPLILGIVMAASAVIAFIAIQSQAKGVGGVSWGVWMIGIAGAATIVLSVLKNKELDKVIAGAKPATKKTEKK